MFIAYLPVVLLINFLETHGLESQFSQSLAIEAVETWSWAMRRDAIDVISYPHPIIGHYVKIPRVIFP